MAVIVHETSVPFVISVYAVALLAGVFAGAGLLMGLYRWVARIPVTFVQALGVAAGVAGIGCILHLPFSRVEGTRFLEAMVVLGLSTLICATAVETPQHPRKVPPMKGFAIALGLLAMEALVAGIFFYYAQGFKWVSPGDLPLT